MIRWVRIFVWMRVRVLVNTVRSGFRRDTATFISRFAEASAPLLLAILLIPLALGLTIAAFVGGYYMASQGELLANGLPLRIPLGVATFLVIISPLVSTMKGETSTSRRLLLLPIPYGLLHRVQVLSGIGDPVIAIVSGVLIAFPLGMAVGGRTLAALITFLAGLTFLGLLICLTAAAGSLLQLLFRDRRRAEWVTSVAVVIMVLLAVTPQLLIGDVESKEGEARLLAVLQAAVSIAPSEFFVNSVRFSLAGRHLMALTSPVILLLAGSLLYGLSWKAFNQLLSSPESSSPRRSRQKRQSRSLNIPGVPPQIAGVAWASARSFLRTARIRLAIFLMPITLPIVGLALSSALEERWRNEVPVSTGVVLAMLAAALALLNSQQVLFNQFGIDRSGLTLQFLSPLTPRHIVLGKLAANGFLVFLTLLGGLLGAVIFNPSGNIFMWLAVPVITLSAFLLLGPAASLLSIFLPHGADLGQWGKKGNPHPTAAFIGVLLIGPSLGPPLALFAVGILFWKNLALAWTALLIWTLFSLLIAWGLTEFASHMLRSRWESLSLTAQDR
ncbi:MAG TPA: hypothetical protein VLV83_20640 [Acidobacteriota bacterium]|nr:hypothetical protein [Acidobacteriota bacterium]